MSIDVLPEPFVKIDCPHCKAVVMWDLGPSHICPDTINYYFCVCCKHSFRNEDGTLQDLVKYYGSGYCYDNTN